MTTREKLHAEIDRLTDEQAEEAYNVLHVAREHADEDAAPLRRTGISAVALKRALHRHSSAAEELGTDADLISRLARNSDAYDGVERATYEKPEESRDVMTMLLEVRFDAPEDFSENLDLYASGEKRIDDVP